MRVDEIRSLSGDGLAAILCIPTLIAVGFAGLAGCRSSLSRCAPLSDNQRVRLPRRIGTVYHGLPTIMFQPVYERESYLAFLGRFTAENEGELCVKARETRATLPTLSHRRRGKDVANEARPQSGRSGPTAHTTTSCSALRICALGSR
jgi:hypothetical protein